jgi:epoxyqueuosine reductase QueG
LEWTPSRLINWAKQAGSSTAELVETIMATRPHPEQGFRSCMGIISLGKKYSPERLELAARRALHIKAYSYKSVKSILENGLDRIPLKPQQQRLPLVEHDNIRGQHYYQ